MARWRATDLQGNNKSSDPVEAERGQPIDLLSSITDRTPDTINSANCNSPEAETNDVINDFQ